MDVHLRDLRYFAVVAQELNVTTAARRLYISQPALSKQLRALEAQLGCELIDRSRRSIALTAAGEALAAEVAEVIGAWERAESRVRATRAQLVVGMQTALGRGLQKRLRDALARRGIVSSFRQAGWDDPSVGLRAGCDLSFAWLPLPDGVTASVLATEPRYVAFCCDHRFTRGGPVTAADLRDEPFVALPQSSPQARDFWLAEETRDGTSAQVAATATSADEAFELVASGVGVMLVAEGNARLYARPGVEFAAVADLAPARLALAWTRRDLDGLAAELAREITEADVALYRAT